MLAMDEWMKEWELKILVQDDNLGGIQVKKGERFATKVLGRKFRVERIAGCEC